MGRVTPEGRVKAAVKKLLTDSKRWGYIYQNWPVPSGYGKSTLDCIGCYRGVFFAVETKAPGGKPTIRQQEAIAEMREAGGAVFVIDDEHNLGELEKFLAHVQRYAG